MKFKTCMIYVGCIPGSRKRRIVNDFEEQDEGDVAFYNGERLYDGEV